MNDLKLFIFNIVFLVNILLLTSKSAFAEDLDDNYVQVTTGLGKILGKRLKIEQLNSQVDQFLGIPYAQPPINENRFHRPKPIIDNYEQQPFMAIDWPPNCRQINVPKFNEYSTYSNQTFQEDCLYLNIWSPVDIVHDQCDRINCNNNNQQKLRPVFVYIHGGCFLYGGSSLPIYDGKIFAAMTDALIVTLNFRLSTFGLLYADKMEEVKGNMVLWDQIMALQWIQNNIRSFGGDPDQITLAGNSAGGWSVTAHILSPLSRNLFKYAVVMSGSVQRQIMTAEKAKKFWLDNIRHTDCANDQDENIDSKMIECLMKMSPEKLEMIPYYTGNGCESYLVVDGEVIPEHPTEMLKKGNFKKDFNVIISTVEEETSGLLSFLAGHLMGQKIGEKFAHENADSLSIDDAIKVIEKMSGQYLSKRPESKDISTLYFNGIRNDEDENVFRKIVGKAFGDVWLACPTIEFGQELKLHSNTSDNIQIYQLYSTFKLNAKPFCPKWAGTCHMDDLFPMFGFPIQYPDYHKQREIDISKELLSLLHSFLRYGRPEQPEWQPYTMIDDDDDKQLVSPSYELANDYQTYRNYHLNYHDVQCRFWKRYY